MKSDLDANRRLKRYQAQNDLPTPHKEERFSAGQAKAGQAKAGQAKAGQKNADQALAKEKNLSSDHALALTHRSDIKSFAELLNHYYSILENSESAHRTLEQITDQGWEFRFDDIGNGGYFIECDQSIIWLDQSGLEACALAASDYFYAATMMNLLRGLRDAWQENRWGGALRTYHPESLLMLEKMRTADSDVVAIVFAKELQAAGYGEFMRHLLASDDAFLGRYFNTEDYMVKVQAASAFRSWFLEPKRVDTTDHETLCFLDTILAEAAHGNPFGRNRLTPIEIVRMGCLPDGTSYLAGYGEAVLRDPVFAGLSDPINQAHYFHLVRDMEAYFVNGVPFRSPGLAAKIFPEDTAVIQD